MVVTLVGDENVCSVYDKTALYRQYRVMHLEDQWTMCRACTGERDAAGGPARRVPPRRAARLAFEQRGGDPLQPGPDARQGRDRARPAARRRRRQGDERRRPAGQRRRHGAAAVGDRPHAAM